MKKFLLLLVFAVVILSYSAISAATTKPDPLYNIYQKLKIGIKRPKIDDIPHEALISDDAHLT